MGRIVSHIPNLPDSARRREPCPYRIDEVCHNAINYLRPWVCKAYCVVQVDQWVRQHSTDADEETIRETVRILAEGTSPDSDVR